jgi:hypothetical protein
MTEPKGENKNVKSPLAFLIPAFFFASRKFDPGFIASFILVFSFLLSMHVNSNSTMFTFALRTTNKNIRIFSTVVRHLSLLLFF